MIKTTVLGGVIFLIPVAVVAIIIGKAYQISMVVAKPIGRLIPIDRVGGVALADIIAILVILFVCYLAGLLARFELVRRPVKALDESLLSIVPGYLLVKSIAGGMAKVQDEVATLTPVVARFDDYAQIAFEIERTAAGDVVLFVPSAPNPLSGDVVLCAADRVDRLEITPDVAVKHLRGLGRGSGVSFDMAAARTAAPPAGQSQG